MDSVKLIEDQYRHSNIGHNSFESILKPTLHPTPQNGHRIDSGGVTLITVDASNISIKNEDDRVEEKATLAPVAVPTIKPKIVKSSIFKPPCNSNTKMLFYEMMGRLLENQLQNCDSSSWNRSFCSQSSSSGEPAITTTTTGQLYPRLYDSDCPFVLQPSLFPLVYPTVYFAAEDGILSTVPNEIKPFLRWKLTTITANTMKAIVVRSGFRLVSADKNNKNKSFKNWNAIWCKHLKVHEFALVGYYQRVNHFPGSFNFGRKDRLWINLKAKAEKYGYDVFGNFHPPTFILPQDYTALVEYWNSSEANSEDESSDDSARTFSPQRKVFICKPPASARGQGISIVSTLDELKTLMANTANAASTAKKKNKTQMVVQEYISNPCLLHNDAKFDLRVYVLVTSISPLRLFIYEEGIVRFAANRYSKNIDDIKNQFIHLTNYSVNKNCLEYVPSSSTDSQDGHKWTLKTLWRYLKMSGTGNVDQIWEQITDLVVKTVISSESQILNLLKQHLKNKRSCFELLGFDIMLDENFKLWLLEVNITPSLRADSVLDFSVKNNLVKDILNTIGYQMSPHFRKFFNFGQFMSPEKNDPLTQMRTANENKHRKFETLFLNDGFEACSEIINELNDDDVFQLMESEDEMVRCGQFRRIFPAKNSRDYLQYFDFPYYYNLLLTFWEEKYHDNRMEGIQRLRSYLLNQPAVQENYKRLKIQLEELENSLENMRETTPN